MDIREILKVSVVGLVHFRIKKYLILRKINIACAERVRVRIILGPVFDSPIVLTFLLFVITARQTPSEFLEIGKNPLLPILAHFLIHISLSLLPALET
jgi:hypothetical protein